MRLVIFDVDGTLVDSQSQIHAAMMRAFSSVGLEAPALPQVRAIVGLSLEVAMARLAPDHPAETHARLAQGYRTAYYEARVAGGAASGAPLFPGAREALLALNAQPETLLAVATGKARRGLDAVIEAHDLHGLFVSRQTADTNPSKPHPAMVEACLSETGIDAAAAVMVGDTSFDMDMARAAGAAALGVTWGYHAPESLGADRLVESFAALPAAIDALLGVPA
ncbi:HAD-IA family hydrolase [Pseudoroseicyclus tamaricis]|uniref:HAD-IA family hydrolase n=1 Tax=Pseudoroseicyclus tamaricis TaxID=2705421 RepID=A0A6B2JWG0_9RHOB|nr:HAD-IA family hydrolase [Pseudoroseicyclus tamaricis]NDV02245.1 HAD-IA family hydrolase [Pseudoroseicyclus tamaricis]